MKKVMVGMSGGVDSSVTALLLKEQNFDVIGATLRLFSDEDISEAQEKGRTCCALSNIQDASAVSERLGVEHIVLDRREEFHSRVMGDFCGSYFGGRTPNPCIRCNRYLKFGSMLDYAVENGCEYIATGHYAVTEFDEALGRWLLKRPKDRSKDQTYVLYSLTQKQLAHTLFPLGGLTKDEVRAIAESYGLLNSNKPDSQDICFVPDGDYVGFIRRFSGKTSPCGDFVDMEGRVLGKHNGIIGYTIGQRKGLGIALGRPAYVVRKDVSANTVTLGDEKDLYTRSFMIEDMNLISVPEISSPIRAAVKTRYSQHEQPAVLSYLGNGRYIAELDEPQRAVTSGQAAVFYDGDTVVCGGTIV